MKAPEKLYCMHRLSGDYSCSTTPFAGGDEYIRKDAFIEKACEWLKDRIEHDSIDYPMATLELLNDFKKAMEE